MKNTPELKDTCLYMHTSKTDGRIFYIGIGNERRPYRKDARNKDWRNFVKDNGYDVTILVENLTWQEACELEIKMIAFYGREDKVGGSLLNKTDGGDGNKNPSEEQRKKMSDSQKRIGNKPPSRKGQKQSEESRKRMSNSKKKMSEETKKKIGQAGIGRKVSKETRNKMSMSRSGSKSALAKKVLNTKTGVYYNTITEAAKVYGVNRRTMGYWLNGQLKNKTTLVLVEQN